VCSAQKGAFLGPAAKEGIALLFPDTSPRGAGVEGETNDWDFGVGAYVPGETVMGTQWSHTDIYPRRRLLRGRDRPEVGETLQYAVLRYGRTSQGYRRGRAPSRECAAMGSQMRRLSSPRTFRVNPYLDTLWEAMVP
jgi:hypothetical protein